MMSLCLQRLLATSFMVIAVFALSCKCDVNSFRQHLEAEKRVLVLDPTAEYKYFEKVDDITTIRPAFAERLGHHERPKRLTRTTAVLWENGCIPYEISSSYSEFQRNEILRALSHYEEKTCLRFKERTNETYYLVFMPGAGCQSFVGKQSRQPQGVSLASACIQDFYLILHEIGHAIGLLHEHTRPDRDDYVDILYDNMYKGSKRFFEIEDPALLDTLGVPYDYNSVMHYKGNVFASHGHVETIVARKDGIPVGPTPALTKLDALKINILYECPDEPPPRSTIYVPQIVEFVFPPLNEGCGMRFNGAMNGAISSPGFPDQYIENQTCEWQIRVATGYQIRFDFVTVDLHESASCQENYVEIYSKLDCTGYLETLRPRCSHPGRPFYTYANTACVRYHSGSPANSPELTGFKMTFTAADQDECYFSHCDHKCVNTPGGFYCTCPEGYFLSADGLSCLDVNECAMEGHMCEYKCENCGGTYKCICEDGSLQEETGSCKSTTTIPETTAPISTIPETTPTTTTTTTPISTTTTPISTTTTTPISTTTTMTILPMQNDKPACPPVFLPQLPICHSVLTEDSGSFSSSNWPKTYNNNEVCDWVIVLPDCTKKIKIEFGGFSVAGRMPECVKDRVSIRKGLEEGGDDVKTFCSLVVPEPIIVDSHIARITMVSGRRHGPKTRLGFTATYQAVNAEI